VINSSAEVFRSGTVLRIVDAKSNTVDDQRTVKRALLTGGAVLLVLFGIGLALTLSVSKRSVEKAHGIKVPASGRNFQQQSCGWPMLLDRSIASVFELDKADLPAFISQLEIKSRNGPEKSGPGNPCINGRNVWPQPPPGGTRVPGNIGDFKQTWTGEAVPVEMLSCGSPKGDWLHVEIWSVGDHALIKLCTNWN